jgi:ornithine cyclodeaminase
MLMPAYVDDMENEALAVKVVSVFPSNKQQGLPIIHAAVLLLEANTGRPKALVAGGVLTALLIFFKSLNKL